MSHQFFILEGQTPVPVSMDTWAKAFNGDRRVALDTVGRMTVSTVFLGLNHRFGGGGPPLLFECAVRPKGGQWDVIGRYSSWDDAMAMHKATVKRVREEVGV